MTAAGVLHWQPPDPAGDLLLQAWKPGAAEARQIRVRPELHRRLIHQAHARRDGIVAFAPGTLVGIPVTIDEQLPTYPGYEIDRIPPQEG